MPTAIAQARSSGVLAMVLAGLAIAACSEHDSPRRVAAQTASGAPVEPKAFTCAGAGPLACNMVPIRDFPADACAHLRGCIEGRKLGEETVVRVEACEAPVLSSASDPGTLAAVAARLEVDGPPSHGAYLFVRLPEGWCAADQLLVPAWTHGGYCKAQFGFEWEGAGADAILAVSSGRVCHMPLDQKEIAGAQSDVASVECRVARYRVARDKIEKLSESRSDRCKSS